MHDRCVANLPTASSLSDLMHARSFNTAGRMAGCVLPLSTVRATMARRDIEVIVRMSRDS